MRRFNRQIAQGKGNDFPEILNPSVIWKFSRKKAIFTKSPSKGNEFLKKSNQIHPSNWKFSRDFQTITLESF